MIAVFLDRDGTIGGDGGGVHPFEFTLYEFSTQAIKILNNSGIKVFLYTNQSWIGSGKFTETTFLSGYKKMEKELKESKAFLNGLYYCPHKPDDECECRKPQPKLLKRAQEEFGLELRKCYVVGDRMSDMLAAENVGSKKILVKTGRGQKSLLEVDEKPPKNLKIDYIADHVLKAADWIVKDLDN